MKGKQTNLEDLSDEDLLVYCSRDNGICSEKLFQTRVEKRYPHLIPSQTQKQEQNEKSWKNLFLEIMYYKNKLKEEFNISGVKQNYKELYELLYSLKRTETLPKEAVLQILLNVEPIYLPQVCNLNRKIQQVCSSNIFKELHKKKYYRFGVKFKEENYLVPDYMSDKENSQIYINITMRSILMEWMFEVCEGYDVMDEHVYYYAVRLVDMFLSRCGRKIPRKELQGVGCVCLNWSLIRKKQTSLPVEQWIDLTANSLAEEDYYRLKNELIDIYFKYNLVNMPTVMDYFSRLWNNMVHEFIDPNKFEKRKEKEYLSIMKVFDKLKKNCFYSLAIKSLDYNFAIKYLPSNIVLAAIKENLYKLSVGDPTFTKEDIIQIQKMENYVDNYINDTNREAIKEIPYGAIANVDIGFIYEFYILNNRVLG